MFNKIIAEDYNYHVDWKLNLPWVQYGGEFVYQFDDETSIIQDVVCMSDTTMAWKSESTHYNVADEQLTITTHSEIHFPVTKKAIALLKLKGIKFEETYEQPIYYIYNGETINSYEAMTCVRRYRLIWDDPL